MITKVVLEKTLSLLMRPIIRLCVRYAVKVHEVENCVKELFVQEARAFLMESGEQESTSKISIMTGLQRPAVTSYLQKKLPASNENLLTKIIGAWTTKKKFLSKQQKPKLLSVEGKSSEFASLVSSVSQALNPYTVLFELERAKLAQKTPKGLKLLSESFNSRHDIEQSLRYLASDITDLASSIEHNLSSPESTFNHHLTTEYDSIPSDKVEKVRQLLLEEGDKIHRKMRKLLSSFDCDTTRQSTKTKSARIAFCSFSTCELKD